MRSKFCLTVQCVHKGFNQSVTVYHTIISVKTHLTSWNMKLLQTIKLNSFVREGFFGDQEQFPDLLDMGSSFKYGKKGRAPGDPDHEPAPKKVKTLKQLIAAGYIQQHKYHYMKAWFALS